MFLLMLCSGLSVAQISLIEVLRERPAALLEARSAAELAVAESQLQLATRLAALAADPALARNLDWQLANSVRGALEARLAPGLADRIVILGETCKTLFHAGKGPNIDCAAAQKAAADGLQTLLTTGGEGSIQRLGLAMRIGDNLLLGDVAIDDVWLSRHPRLKSALERTGVTLQRVELALSPSAIVVGRTGGLRIVTRQPLDRFFRLDAKTQTFAGSTPEFFNPFLWPTLGATAVFAIWAFARSVRRRLRLKDAIRDHAEALLPNETDREVHRTKLAPERALAAVKAHWTATHAAMLDERREFRTKLTQYEAKVKALEGEVIALEARLTAQAGFESLASQLSAATRPFLERLAHLREVAENLQDITTNGVVKYTETLSLRLAAWRRGLAERGSRKFIRGLAESPSEVNHEQSLLDDEINTFAKLGDELKDLALATHLGAQATLHETVEIRKLAAHWEALAEGAARPDRNLSIAAALHEAVMLATASGYNIPPIDLAEAQCAWPTLPARTAVSALYHLLAALAQLQTPGTPIAARVRREYRRTMAVFSVHSGNQVTGMNEQQTKHIETAKALLSPHGITMSVLPTRSGAAPILLRWDDHRDEVPLATRSFDLSGPGQRC